MSLQEARFIAGSRGRLLEVRSVPHSSAVQVDDVVIMIPPFAEELNCARTVLAHLRRRFAERGAIASMLDLYGTGDSEGKFENADGIIWRTDLKQLVEAYRAAGYERIHLFAVRSGCLLLQDSLDGLHGAIASVQLVQPILSGAELIRQWLRTATAGDLLAGQAGSPPADPRYRLQAGQSVELAGYRMTPQLMASLESIEIQATSPTACQRGVLFDLQAASEGPAAAAYTRFADGASRVGWDVDVRCHASRAFWQRHDSRVDETLLELLCDAQLPRGGVECLAPRINRRSAQ